MVEEDTQIQFSYQGKHLEGLVVQVQNGQITVKLDSGYNMIVPEGDLQDVKEVKRAMSNKSAPRVKQNPTLPKVAILHTGGTIASKVDYETGGVEAQFEPEELIGMFPEMTKVANISSTLLGNMWSQDMRFAHYNIMGRAIQDEIQNGVKGVIITHGTDFIHYTGAALTFMLDELSVPVVIVGSQRSSDRGSSDASTNLMGALRFIAQGIPGVFVAMHEGPGDDVIAIHEGVHVRKNHTSRRDAFASINAPQFGRVVNEKVEILNAPRAEALKKNRKTRVLPFNETLKVGLWKTHPQSFVDELKAYDDFDGLIIEGSGLGHGPTSGIDEFTREQHPFIREKIGKLAAKMPVVMTSQTIWGRINLNVYAPQRKLLELGVLGDGCDMTPETAFIKLAWLLSNYDRNETKKKFGENLRGEITEKSQLEDTHKGT